MKRVGGALLVLLALVGVALAPGAALAATLSGGGAVVTIQGLADFNATASDQAKNGLGQVMAILLGLGGAAMVVGGRPGLGLTGVGASLGMGFIPGSVSSAFNTATPASFDSVFTLVTGPAAAWLGFWGKNLPMEPVFLVCMGVALSAQLVRHRRALRVAVAA